MSGLTPEWAMTAYDRLMSARRDIPEHEREAALQDSDRRQKRATMLRRLERPA